MYAPEGRRSISPMHRALFLLWIEGLVQERSTKMADQARMSISLDSLLKQQLVDYAKQQDISQSDVVSDALTMYLEIKQGLYDYNEPALERLNQITDALVGLRTEEIKNRETMERVEAVLLRYMNGESYYAE